MNPGVVIDQFRKAMRADGIAFDGELIADGKVHRFDAEGDRRGRKDAWYVLHGDGVPNGTFGHWQRGMKGAWCAKSDEQMTPEERAEQARRIEAARVAREEEDRKRKTNAARKAAALWRAAAPASADHAYLRRKGVQPHGLRVATWRKWHRDEAGEWIERLIADALLVPIREVGGALRSLEAIFPEKGDDGRDKDFLPGGEKAGCLYMLGELVPDGVALLCEGFATGASLHECTGHAVAVAFDAGNLAPVARALRAKHPALRLVVCADNDRKTEGNPGATKASEAASACGGVACLPTFADDEAGSDWNDVHATRGAEAVRAAVAAAVAEAVPSPSASMPATKGETRNGTKGEAVASATPATAGGDGAPGSPARFDMNERGLWFTEMGRDGMPRRPRFVVEPFEVLALVRDHGGGGWGLLLELRDPDRRAHRVVVPHVSLRGEGADALGLLAERGCLPRFGTDRFLVEYLREARPEKRARITDRTGWHEGGAFVLPGRALGDGDEPVIFQSDTPGANTFKAKGTAASWREHIGALCVGNSRLVFGVSAALASPLLHLVGSESGGFHYRGGSSSGKTTILRVAASLCGPPEYMARWRSTDNGLEGLALQHSDCPLLLDELAQLDPKAAGEVAYMLGNGTGKTRASRTGSMRERATWRVLFQSAGEIGLSEHMAEVGRKTKAGQEIRLCEIPAEVGAGLGCFSTLHGHNDGAAFANALDSATRSHYGTVFPEFIERVMRYRDALPKLLRDLSERFSDDVLSASAEGQARRVAHRFAIVATAGTLATEFGLTGWPADEAVNAARTCFRAWLARRGGESNSEDRAALRQVRVFLSRHSEGRFADWDRPGIDSSERAPTKSDRVGYRRMVSEDANDGQEHFVFYETWREVVCAGLDAAAVGRLMVDRGYAERGTEATRPHVVKVSIPAEGRRRVVHILPTIFEAEDD